jgi:Sulfotransferase family
VSWQALKSFFPGKPMARYIVPLPEHDLVYIKNPKSGSSTLMVWLDRLHTGDVDSELSFMHRDNRLPKVREVGRDRILAMLAGEAYRFSFVRHPVHRMESVYWAKMSGRRGYRMTAGAALGLSTDPDVEVSFEEFLAAVERQDPIGLDAHWRPQHLNLMHPVVRYDRVGRLESFAADLKRIRDEAGLPDIPVEQMNVSPRDRSESVYDGRPDLVRRVERLYSTDLELYGY